MWKKKKNLTVQTEPGGKRGNEEKTQFCDSRQTGKAQPPPDTHESLLISANGGEVQQPAWAPMDIC